MDYSFTLRNYNKKKKHCSDCLNKLFNPSKDWFIKNHSRYNSNYLLYSHLSNKRGGKNKRRGGAKVAKSINAEVGITLEVGIFFEKSINVEGGFLCGGWIFFFQKTPFKAKKGPISWINFISVKKLSNWTT